jgi:putative membrane protein
MTKNHKDAGASSRRTVRPAAIVLTGRDERQASAAAEEKPPERAATAQPRALSATMVREEAEDPFAHPAAPHAPAGNEDQVLLPRASFWLRLLIASLAGLLFAWLAESAWSWLQARLAEETPVSRLLLALAALAALSAVALLLRELLALIRLRRITRLHVAAETALRNNDETAMDALGRELTALYTGRRELREALERIRAAREAILTPAERLALLEKELLAPLDAQARRAMISTARRIAVLTAMIPMPALDMAIVGLQTLRLIRGIATLYGARPGWLGGFRLLRMSVAHLAIAGAVAFSDTLLQTVLGRGLAGRLSARFGEGAVNALLAIRLGIAAMEIVRPLPFAALSRPSLAALARAALTPGNGTPRSEGETDTPAQAR